MNEQNDKYPGNLLLLKQYTVAWKESHPRYKPFQNLMYAMLIIGLVIATIVALTIARHKDIYLHITIWIVIVAAFSVLHYVNGFARPPFSKLHNVRFEMSDEGIYYIFQRKMRLCTYFIHDEDIKEMIFDDEAHVLYISGKAILKSMGGDKKVVCEDIDEIYAMVPMDQYDREDMLEPYGDTVRYEPGVLRGKYLYEGCKAQKGMADM